MPVEVIGSQQAWAGEPITIILVSEWKHIGGWLGVSCLTGFGFKFLNSPFLFVLGVLSPHLHLIQNIHTGIHRGIKLPRQLQKQASRTKLLV